MNAQLIFLLLGLLALLVVLYVVYKLKSSPAFSAQDIAFFRKQWQRVESLLPVSHSHAVLEADKIFDHALKKLGYTGNFVDKFRPAQKLVGNPEAVWTAHKLRNRIAHESGFEAHISDAKKATSAFKRALEDLGVRL